MLRHPPQAPPIANSGMNLDGANQPPQPPPPPGYVSPFNEVGGMEYLKSNEWPTGLATALMQNAQKIAMRFFIIDDSGSMATNDGHRVVGKSGQKVLVNCTRWVELGDAMKFHAGLAYSANIPSQFRLLNGSLPIMVGRDDPEGVGYRRIVSLLDSSPNGFTPLCKHVSEVIHEIRAMEAFLRATNQKVIVMIATDGESSDGDLATALKPLETLPALVVIRLCTDEDKVCNYWNDIDKVLELELDILDDLQGEAGEVTENNTWLTYGEPLHRMREFGVTIKEFDLLDEDKLSSDQIMNFIAIIFGLPVSEFPHPQIDWKGFKDKVSHCNKAAGHTWDPISKRYVPWIKENKLSSFFKQKGGQGGCVIC